MEDTVAERTDLIRLDPEGDVLLTLKDGAQRVLVSSKILSLASPVFKKLFASSFREGAKLAESSYAEIPGIPEIPLYEDDPSAMKTMLSILHHQSAYDLAQTAPESIAILAICCNKYKCVEPIRPWIETWLLRPFTSTMEDFGFMLFAAHLFRSEELFSGVYAKIIKSLSTSSLREWKKNERLAALPRIVMGEIDVAPLIPSLLIIIRRLDDRYKIIAAQYVLRNTICGALPERLVERPHHFRYDMYSLWTDTSRLGN